MAAISTIDGSGRSTDATAALNLSRKDLSVSPDRCLMVDRNMTLFDREICTRNCSMKRVTIVFQLLIDFVVSCRNHIPAISVRKRGKHLAMKPVDAPSTSICRMYRIR